MPARIGLQLSNTSTRITVVHDCRRVFWVEKLRLATTIEFAMSKFVLSGQHRRPKLTPGATRIYG